MNINSMCVYVSVSVSVCDDFNIFQFSFYLTSGSCETPEVTSSYHVEFSWGKMRKLNYYLIAYII